MKKKALYWLLALPAAAWAASSFWQAHVRSQAPAGGSFAAAQAIRPAKLRYSPDCVLKATAWRFKVELKDSIPVPPVRRQSDTPLKDFQDAIEPQWGLRPDVFLNAYVAHKNEVYLIDDADYYEKMGRYLDDSLAHEYVHFLQVKYKDIPMTEFSEWEEQEAVTVQTWFRDNYFKGTPPAGAPACSQN